MRGVKKGTAAANVLAALNFDPSDPKSASLIAHLYTPDTRLKKHIKTVDALFAKGNLSQQERQQLGYALEDIVLLAFQNLTNASSLQSYQSAAAQHDLVVDGPPADTVWLALCRALYIDKGTGTGILVEAKATEKPVGDREFERLGNILTHYFERTVGIGVFIAINGASGFPKRNGKRVKALHSARLTQAIVYHRLRKPIVVLDWDDIKTLTAPGSLVQLIANKVREIEALSGLKSAPPPKPVVDVPARMKPLIRLKP